MVSSMSFTGKDAFSMSEVLKIANQFRNLDIRFGIPKGYEHISGMRLQSLCRKLGIRYADALVGWGGTKKFPKPILDGVVVICRSAVRLRSEIQQRNRRNPPEKRIQAALRRAESKEKENDRLWEMGIAPSGRTAMWLRHKNIDEYEARLIAFKATYRHEFTNYDQLLGAYDRDEARASVEERIIPSNWLDYVASYPFPFPEVADVLSRVLKDPQQAHPVWFCEAILAVRWGGLALDNFTYAAIHDAITEWRSYREHD